MIWRILICKIKVFGNFFTFSDINGSVEDDSSDFDWLFSSDFRLLMFFGLLDCFFFSNRLGLRWWGWLNIDFTDDVNTFYWGHISNRFLGFNFGSVILDFWLRINFWLNLRLWLWLNNFDWFVRLRRWNNYWLSWLWWLSRWLDRFLVYGWFLFLHCGFRLLCGCSSGNWFHSTSEEKIVHIFLEIGSFSIGIEGLLLVLNGWFVIIVDT